MRKECALYLDLRPSERAGRRGMAGFVYFTDEQKQRANEVDLEDFLSRQGEKLLRSGREKRLASDHSITVRGNRWYDHAAGTGGCAIDFVQMHYNSTFPEAVTLLLGGEQGQAYRASGPEQEKEQKPFALPEANQNMRRVYAYLTKTRCLDREVVSAFAREKLIYEDAKYHNAVFVGYDADGTARHAHKRGSYTKGEAFKGNVDGSDPRYSFRYLGKGSTAYVFEAPIDMLSFITLYRKDWQENSYVALNGISGYAMLQMLEDNPKIDTVILCLDHDPAGIENSYRLADIIKERKTNVRVRMLQPANKDWNEDLKAENGIEPIPAREHPRITECRAWCGTLKGLAEDIDPRHATAESLKQYHYGMCQTLKKGTGAEQMEDAFDGDGLVLAGIAVRIMEKYGRELGREASPGQIIDNLCGRYRPHKDKGNLKSRLADLQNAFESVMACFAGTGPETDEEKETLIKKCVGLTMECIRAHIFVAEKLQVQKQEGGMGPICSQL